MESPLITVPLPGPAGQGKLLCNPQGEAMLPSPPAPNTTLFFPGKANNLVEMTTQVLAEIEKGRTVILTDNNASNSLVLSVALVAKQIFHCTTTDATIWVGTFLRLDDGVRSSAVAPAKPPRQPATASDTMLSVPSDLPSCTKACDILWPQVSATSSYKVNDTVSKLLCQEFSAIDRSTPVRASSLPAIEGDVVEVNGRKITACQEPISPTEIVNFWCYVWESRVALIIKLVPTRLGGKHYDRQTREYTEFPGNNYWSAPVLQGRLKQRGITITLTSIEKKQGLITRTLVLRGLNDEVRVVQQIDYGQGADFYIPPIGDFVKTINHAQTAIDDLPGDQEVLVHCAHGRGRTGTFLMGLAVARMTQRTQIPEQLLELRKCRHGMVESPDQYLLLHRLLWAKVNGDRPPTLYVPSKPKKEYHITGGARLPAYTPRPLKQVTAETDTAWELARAKDAAATTKLNCLLAEEFRSIGHGGKEHGSGALRALDADWVEVDGRRFLAFPEPKGIWSHEALWEELFKAKVTTLVKLVRSSSLFLSPGAIHLGYKEPPAWMQFAGEYFPALDKTMNFSKIGVSVTCIAELKISTNLLRRTFTVTKGPETHEVTHLDFGSWPDMGAPKLEDLAELLKVYHEVRGNGPTAVHCMMGRGRTGTFLAAANVCNLTSRSQIPELIATLRSGRSGLVESATQYVLLHRLYMMYKQPNELIELEQPQASAYAFY